MQHLNYFTGTVEQFVKDIDPKVTKTLSFMDDDFNLLCLFQHGKLTLENVDYKSIKNLKTERQIFMPGNVVAFVELKRKCKG